MVTAGTCSISRVAVTDRVDGVVEQQQDDAVVLTIRLRPEPPPSGVCAGSIAASPATIDLQRPIGARALVIVRPDGRRRVLLAPADPAMIRSVARRYRFTAQACRDARRTVGRAVVERACGG